MSELSVQSELSITAPDAGNRSPALRIVAPIPEQRIAIGARAAGRPDEMNAELTRPHFPSQPGEEDICDGVRKAHGFGLADKNIVRALNNTILLSDHVLRAAMTAVTAGKQRSDPSGAPPDPPCQAALQADKAPSVLGGDIVPGPRLAPFEGVESLAWNRVRRGLAVLASVGMTLFIAGNLPRVWHAGHEAPATVSAESRLAGQPSTPHPGVTAPVPPQRIVAQADNSPKEAEAPSMAPDPDMASRRDYELAERVGTRQAWEAYLAVYDKGLYAYLARAQLDKLNTAQAAETETRERAEKEQADRLARQRQAAEQTKLEAEQREAEQEAKLKAERLAMQRQEEERREANHGQAEDRQPDREEAPQATAKADPAQCRHDVETLQRLRANPTHDEVIRFARDLSCGELRPQVQRLVESVGG